MLRATDRACRAKGWIIKGLLVTGIAALTVLPGTSAFAAPGGESAPQNRPERGEIYDGLDRADASNACRQGFVVRGTNLCTHGPDGPEARL